MTRPLTHPMSVSDALVTWRDWQAQGMTELWAMDMARMAARGRYPAQPLVELSAVDTALCKLAFDKARGAGLDEAHAMLAALEEDERLMAEQRESTNPFLRPAHMPVRRAE